MDCSSCHKNIDCNEITQLLLCPVCKDARTVVRCSRCNVAVRTSKLYAKIVHIFTTDIKLNKYMKLVLNAIIGGISIIIGLIAICSLLWCVFPGATRLGVWVGTKLCHWNMPNDIATPSIMGSWLLGLFVVASPFIAFFLCLVFHDAGDGILDLVARKYKEHNQNEQSIKRKEEISSGQNYMETAPSSCIERARRNPVQYEDDC